MDDDLRNTILNTTGATDLSPPDTLQLLWSGYGSIDRYWLNDSKHRSVVVKHVRLPQQPGNHPRGWNTTRSQQRKLHSYQVETTWYKQWAECCTDACRVPSCLALKQQDQGFLIVMEDLDGSGYPVRKEHATERNMAACLHWLANFHALFIGKQPQGLWETGTYWHLETRPDELAEMPETALKKLAPLVDQRLKTIPFQTLVHGDAKLANFCFSEDETRVAGVDFQYVGGGCGMKDVAYFMSSCLTENDCERMETTLLDIYFAALEQALLVHQPQLDPAEVEAAWRDAYSLAWTDFYRFLQGWSPGHWKIHRYSERLANEVTERLKQA